MFCHMIRSNICKNLKDDKEYYIPKHLVSDAIVGDLVNVEIKPSKEEGKLDRASVNYVSKRNKNFHIAYVCGTNPYRVCLINNDHVFRLTFDPLKINIPKLNIGQEILVTLNQKNAEFELETSLYTEEEILTKIYGLDDYDYDQKIKNNVDKRVINLTELDTFTVDNESSTDLDDAISIDSKNNKVYIHIADLSRWVPHDSKLDRRLLDRQTSIYLKRRTFHMSPKELVDKYCSLNEGIERYAITFEFEWDPITKKIKEEQGVHYRSLIKSKRRLTYDFCNSHGENDDDLKLAKEIYMINKKEKNLSNETTNPEYEYNQISHIQLTKPNDWHSVIEYYMILVNMYVVRYCIKKNLQIPKRVHPEPKHMEEYNRIKNMTFSSEYPEEFKLCLLFRLQQPSFYSVKDSYHFGLGIENYSHATSPIRRYIDLVVQRIITGDYIYNSQELEKICDITNNVTDKKKQVNNLENLLYDMRYAMKQMNKTLKGIVIGIKQPGIQVYFIELMKYFFIENENIDKSIKIEEFMFVNVKLVSVTNKITWKITK